MGGKIFSFENKSVNVSPENTPFLIFSIDSTTIIFVVTDLAMSKLSKISTPAWFKFPKTKDTLAKIDF